MHNPSAGELGIKTEAQLKDFVENDLPNFKLVTFGWTRIFIHESRVHAVACCLLSFGVATSQECPCSRKNHRFHYVRLLDYVLYDGQRGRRGGVGYESPVFSVWGVHGNNVRNVVRVIFPIGNLRLLVVNAFHIERSTSICALTSLS